MYKKFICLDKPSIEQGLKPILGKDIKPTDYFNFQKSGNLDFRVRGLYLDLSGNNCLRRRSRAEDVKVQKNYYGSSGVQAVIEIKRKQAHVKI